MPQNFAKRAKRIIDLNADLGEMETPAGRAAEHEILRYITSANLACGGHAGNPKIMDEMCRAAKARGVVIGAHPSYPDRENFGRRSWGLGVDISARDLSREIMAQIVTLCEIAAQAGARVAYVKPHGALYTDAAKQAALAALIAKTVAALDPALPLMGFPGGIMEDAAKRAGLKFIGEGFIDRLYTQDGSLTPRGEHGAVIEDEARRQDQLLSLALFGQAALSNGALIAVNARSLCLHGDSQGAVKTARAARKALIKHGVKIESFAQP